MVALGGSTPEEFREQIKICKNNTDKPFGVNLLLLHDKIDEIVDIVVEEKVGVVIIGVGNPGIFMDRLLSCGAKVIPVVTNSSLTIKMKKADAHTVIAEDYEAGDHTI